MSNYWEEERFWINLQQQKMDDAMYYKDIEQDKEVSRLRDVQQKRNAAQRLADVAAKKKQNKLRGG